MPTLNININNDTTKWNAIRQSYSPPNNWNPEPPFQIRFQENGQAKLTAATGYGTAGLIYQSTSEDGTVTLRLEINEGNEGKPIAFTSDPSLVKAEVKAEQLSTDKWLYQLKWKHG